MSDGHLLGPAHGKGRLGRDLCEHQGMARRIVSVLVLVSATFAAAGATAAPSQVVFEGIDRGLCPFPLAVVIRTDGPPSPATPALHFKLIGPATIVLRNGSTGRTATLESSGSYTVSAHGSIAFRGRRLWYWATGERVPFAATTGAGSLNAPTYVLSRGGSNTEAIDPCALVAASPTSTRPAATTAPWELPAYALSQMAYARLTPLIGRLIRHDHVHLDVIVDGKKVTIPAGVGLAEPHDSGPCPPNPISTGDCSTHHIFVAEVANSPIHTHSSSGIIHIEPDRPGIYTLGEFFDEWGVRLTDSCLGGYCTGDGKELRVYVNGKRVAGGLRQVALTDRQEIAVVFGAPRDFRSVPATYTGGWPGLGCGGAGEPSC